MRLTGNKIILRDYIESDIDDVIRWMSSEREWLDWDAPWEQETEEPFDPGVYRVRMLARLRDRRPDESSFRRSLRICVNDASEKHIGWINTYRIDDHFEPAPGARHFTIGISIPDLSARRRGFATEAWSLYIDYALDHGIPEIYTQTWSGNLRVLGLIDKLGFVEAARDPDFQIVRGESVDGLTFRLDPDRYRRFRSGGAR